MRLRNKLSRAILDQRCRFPTKNAHQSSGRHAIPSTKISLPAFCRLSSVPGHVKHIQYDPRGQKTLLTDNIGVIIIWTATR